MKSETPTHHPTDLPMAAPTQNADGAAAGPTLAPEDLPPVPGVPVRLAQLDGIETAPSDAASPLLGSPDLNIEMASGETWLKGISSAKWGRFRADTDDAITPDDSTLGITFLPSLSITEGALLSSSLSGSQTLFDVDAVLERYNDDTLTTDEEALDTPVTVTTSAPEPAPEPVPLPPADPLVLVGTSTGDVLVGDTGDDTLTGMLGADSLNGGDGADILYGDLAGTFTSGAGGDVMDGGAGNDILFGEQGDDLMRGGDGDDKLYGSFDNDTLYGDAGADYLDGGQNQDVLYGGDGDDTLVGGTGTDALYGEGGNDTLNGYADGGLLSGGDGNDVLYGTTATDTLIGGAGDDILQGGSGSDTYVMGEDSLGGHDVITDFAGTDTLSFDGLDPFTAIASVTQSGTDLVFANSAGGTLTIAGFFSGNVVEKISIGADTYVLNTDFTGTASFADFLASTPNLYLEGTAGADALNGDTGDDTLYGHDGADTLNGGDGADLILGGNQSDVIDGGAGDDLLLGDTNYSTAAAGDDLIYGGAGNDRLYGEQGSDVLRGGDGDDQLFGGTHVDWLYGDAGADTLWGGSFNDYLEGGADNDILNGENGDDNLVGGTGDDILEGGRGNDLLTGGDGADQFWIVKWTGVDTVTDFDESQGDKINVQALGVSDLSGASIADDGAGNTLVVFGSYEKMILSGVSASSIGADDFIF